MMYLERKKLQLMLNRKFRGYLKTVTGNSITLEDCTDDYPSSVSVSGMTYQGNPDDNYLDILDVWDNPSGTLWGNFKYKYIKLKPNTHYTLSTNAPVTESSSGDKRGLFYIFSGKNTGTWYYSSTRAGVASENSPATWCTDNEGYLTIMILYVGGNINCKRDDLVNDTYWVMLSEGNTALEYKPYTKLTSTNPKEMFSCGEKTSNIFNANNRNMVTVKKYSVDKDGWVTIEHDNTNGSSTSIPAYCTYRSMTEIKPNTAYKVITEIKETSNCKICSVTTSNADPSQFVNPTVTHGVTGTFIEDVVSAEDFSKSSYMLRTLFYIPANTKGKIVFRISLVEDTTITEDTFLYEPYGQYKVPIEQSGNLFDVRGERLSGYPWNYFNLDDDDYISFYRDNSTGSSTCYSMCYTKKSSMIKPNRFYTIVVEVKELSGCKLNIVSNNVMTPTTGQFRVNQSCTSAGIYNNYIISREDLSTCYSMLRTECSVPAGKIGKAVFRISVFEGNLSTPIEDFVYEPYCGKTEKYNIYVPEQLRGGTNKNKVFSSDIINIDVDNKIATLIKNFGSFAITNNTLTGFWNTNEYALLGKNVCNFRTSSSKVLKDGNPKKFCAVVCNRLAGNLDSPWIAGSAIAQTMTERITSIDSASGLDFTINYETIGFPLYESVEALPQEATEGQLARVNSDSNYLWYKYSSSDGMWVDSGYSTGVKGDKAFRSAMETALKAWLTEGNTIEGYYELNTPIETDISDLQDWDSISKLNKGRNIIVAESIERPSSIEITYYSS